ncbi:hypothetical protein YC2023_114264 [Brassica napus]
MEDKCQNNSTVKTIEELHPSMNDDVAERERGIQDTVISSRTRLVEPPRMIVHLWFEAGIYKGGQIREHALLASTLSVKQMI